LFDNEYFCSGINKNAIAEVYIKVELYFLNIMRKASVGSFLAIKEAFLETHYGKLILR